MQLDLAFNEICKISAIKATTALSKFLQIPVGMNIKPVEVSKIKESEFLENPTEKTVNIYAPITGNLPGSSFFLYTTESALQLCDVLFHRKQGSTQAFMEPEKSALSEVTNIVIGNFLDAFAQALQMDFLMHRSAIFDCGSFKATVDHLPGITEQIKTAVVKISFGFQHIDIKGWVLIFFDEKKMRTALEKIAK